MPSGPPGSRHCGRVSPRRWTLRPCGRSSLDYAERKYLPAADRLSAGYPPEQRQEHARIVALDRQDVLHGIENHHVPECAEPWLSAMLGKHRCPVTVGEALPFIAMLMELRHESHTDSARTFPLRVKRLAERRALLAIGAARCRWPPDLERRGGRQTHPLRRRTDVHDRTAHAGRTHPPAAGGKTALKVPAGVWDGEMPGVVAGPICLSS